MSLRDSLVKLVQNSGDFSPFYNNTSDLIYKNNKLKEENAAHEKAVASLKLKYNQGQITKEQFDSDMQALLNSKTNVVDTTKLNVKTPTDTFNPLAKEYRTAQSRENKLHKEKIDAIENTNSEESIKAAKTKYDKTKADLQEKLNNETITQEQYDEQLSQADEAFKNATGMSYNASSFVNALDTYGTRAVAHTVARATSKASDAYVNASSGGAFGNMSNVGVSPDGYSTGLRAQAQEDVRQAGDEQRNMQQNFQIANRNYRDEAGRDAAMKAASQNAQRVNNAAAGVGSGAAAMIRDVVTPDTQAYMNRQDAQRKEGVENQRQMHAAQQEAIRRNTNANGYDYTIADANRYNAAVGALSNNNAKTYSRDEAKDTTKDTTKDTEPTDTVDPLEGYSSADLRNLQALLSNEYIKSAHPQTGDGNPETGDYKFYPNTTDNTEVAPTDLSETYTFAQLKESNPEYAQRLLNIYNSLKRMLANPQTRAAIYSRAKANAPSDYTIAATSKDAEIDDMHLLQDYISSTENNTTRKKGGTTADEARRQGTVTNESNINLNPNVTAALNSNMRS